MAARPWLLVSSTALPVLFVLLVAAFAGGGCWRSTSGPDAAVGAEPEGHLRVVATIFPLADLARNIAGDAVEVACLLPVGASPHTFEPRPS